MQGPRIQDPEFFARIDTSRPGLEGIPQAVAAGDFALARKLFAAEVRRSLQPQRFLKINREFRGYHFMKDGETLEQAVDRILEGELVSTSTPFKFTGEVDWYSNPTFNQYKEWTWQLSRHPEWALLAERYRQTGDERLAAKFVFYFESWVHQCLVPENAGGHETWAWRTIEAGIRMGGAWQWALHTFYQSPHFTDDVLVDWYKSIWEHGWRLRNFHRTGNWLIMEMNGLAQIAILYPQFKDASAWQAYAFDKLVEELDAQIYPDGWQVELSTGYHQVDIHNYQWLIDVCNAYAVPIPPAFHATMEKMHAVNVLMSMPDGRLPDLNDGGWHPISELMTSAVPDYPQRADFRWALTRGAEGQPPAETSLAFPYAGYLVMRSGWQPDALWALLDAGHFGYGHQHEDKLNLLVHAYGRMLLTEGGNYAYDSSAMRVYVLSERAHNTIRVDGEDQNRRLHYDRDVFDVRQPSDGRLKVTPAYDVAEGVYDEGYGPQAERVLRHERKVIFLKQGCGGLGPCWLVVDRLIPAGAGEHSLQAIWHFDTHTLAAGPQGAASSDPGQANLTILAARQAGWAVRVVRGQEEPEFQGWKAVKDHQQGQYEPIPTALFERRIAGPARLVTLLYPTPPGAACPVKDVSAAAGLSATAITLTLSDGSLVELDEVQF